MTIVFVTTTEVGSGTRASTETSNVDYHITGGGVLGSSDTIVLNLRGSQHDVIVEGTVSGAATAILLGNGLSDTGHVDYENSVHIAEGGLVRGATGVMLWSSGHVSNSGEIAGGNSGISYIGEANSSAVIVNDGLIVAKEFGILSSLEGSSYATVVNTGFVSTAYAGLYAYGAAGNINRVTNYGTISGDVASYYSYDVTDFLTNRGEMRGDIWLGKGNDRYDGRGGRIVDGKVMGEEGDDRFLAGDGEEVFDGGAGVDTLDFRSSAGLRVSLMDDSGSGAALGDTYLGIERVLGSRFGSDLLIGNDDANTLEGFGGRDALRGGGGDDSLVGGAEADRLWGGAGNDLFVFAAPGQGGDIIADWGAVAGNDDAIRIEVAGFGAGLAAGALSASRFVTRLSDSLAQEADDRFVFRKDTATLWWDADGKGGAAAVLLADLQAGAVVTAADILLV